MWIIEVGRHALGFSKAVYLGRFWVSVLIKVSCSQASLLGFSLLFKFVACHK